MSRACSIPDAAGPSWWASFEGIARAIRDAGCESCGREALRLVSLIHDLVNVELGRPVFDPANVKHFASRYAYALEMAGGAPSPQLAEALALSSGGPCSASPSDCGAGVECREMKQFIRTPCPAPVQLGQSGPLIPTTAHGFPSSREIAYSVCQNPDGSQFKTRTTTGTHNTSSALPCPHPARTVAIMHTHPNGSTALSGTDLAGARNAGVSRMCVGVPQTGELVCHTVGQ